LSRVAPTARKILVAGLVDRGYPTITHDELEGFRRKNGFAAFVETSSKTGEGIDDLRRELEAAIPWGELPATAPPELWDEFREFVMRPRSLRAALLKLSQLREIFRSEYSGHIFTDADFNQAVEQAQEQRLIRQLSFGDLVLLSTELLDGYASAIVRAARKTAVGCVSKEDVLNGRIDFEDLERLHPELERPLLNTVLEPFIA